MFAIGLTDHLESPVDRPSAEVYAEASETVRLADALGVRYAWFAEHHAHVHRGHLPAPLLLALHLAGATRHIQLGMAVTCLNLHGALETAEQVAVADCLMNGRLAPGFGSGSTPAEAAWLGVDEPADESERHATVRGSIKRHSRCLGPGPDAQSRAVSSQGGADLRRRTWIAVNSAGVPRLPAGSVETYCFLTCEPQPNTTEYAGAIAPLGVPASSP